MNIQLPNGWLSAIDENDAEELVQHLQDKDVSAVALSFPFPYTMEHALHFIEYTKNSPHDFAIRDNLGYLIGHIKTTINASQPHKAIIGYWLGKKYWGKGIMTETVKVFTNFCFKEFGLTRIGASCFEENIGSARVLEKAGFQYEGLATKLYRKDNQFYNAKLYGKVI